MPSTVQACGAGVGTIIDGHSSSSCLRELRAGDRVVCVPNREWSALDGNGTWQQVACPPHPSKFFLWSRLSVMLVTGGHVKTLIAMHICIAAVDIACSDWVSGVLLQMSYVPERNLYPVPDGVTDEEAAQFAVR